MNDIVRFKATNGASAALNVKTNEAFLCTENMKASTRDNLLMCLAHDGIDFLVIDGFSYVPITWLRKELPEMMKRLDDIERNLLKSYQASLN